MWGVVRREGLRWVHQRGRFISALVRPLVWLVIFAAGFRFVLGVSIIPPYETYVPYEVYIAPGLVAIAGGKYTTYRVMGADAVDEAVADIPSRVAESVTEKVPLLGADGYFALENQAEQVAERDGLLGLFRASLREQEAALLAVRAQQSAVAEQIAAQADAEVHSLPRRSRPVDPERVIDAEMADLAMILPNYEATRRYAV